ncbi:MAG: NAD(P)-dependent oxidoreductase [Mesorhizobium sp.]
MRENTRVWDTFYPQNPARLCTVGIMGLGVMGQSSAEMLRNMGLPVIGWSRSPKNLPGIESFHGQEGLGAFLARTQILVSQLPATPETKNIFSAPLLSQLPKGAALINAGRGSQHNIPDIIAALDEGHLAGAVLDVFDTEPLPADSPIWSHPKIVVTCHIASSPTKLECTRYALDLIAAFERGDELPNLYDPTRGY